MASGICCIATSFQTNLQRNPLHKAFSHWVLPSRSFPLYFRNAVVSRSTEASPHPSIWGDQFLQASPPDSKLDILNEERITKLKRETKRMLQVAISEPLQEMEIVNNIQRLGLAYHFELEIEDVLERMHKDVSSHHVNYNLYAVALQFRLLRQEGFYVSPDVFEKFRNEKGVFNVKLSDDVKGMLSLYEAAHLSMRGEDILDKAIAFTTHHMKLIVNHLSHNLAKQVEHALELPLHKRFTRIEARQYISLYQEDISRNELLLEFAKLDFNMIQSMHLRELDQVSRWWRDVDIVNKQPFPMRDRLVEAYVMATAFFFEPKHSFGRIYMTKIICYESILDDYYDVDAKMDKLELLTDAILRQDWEAIHKLPEYMKVTVLDILKTFEEIDQEMTQREQPYSIAYIKQATEKLIKYLLEEAKLMEPGHIPNLEELYRLSIVTIGVFLLAVGLIVDSHEHVSKEALDWIINWPAILTSTCLICRIKDDIGTFKFEQERGLNISGVTCYMKEHRVSESTAIENLRKMIPEKWKDLNKECIRPTPVPMRLLVLILNMARTAEVFYKDGDGYTNSTGYTKDIIDMLLVNPVPI